MLRLEWFCDATPDYSGGVFKLPCRGRVFCLDARGTVFVLGKRHSFKLGDAGRFGAGAAGRGAGVSGKSAAGIQSFA